MNNIIRHAGIIESIEYGHIRVKVTQSSACASCKIANHCNASESKERIIDVYQNANTYTVGQEVVVSVSEKNAFHAVGIGFGIPLLILMGILAVLKSYSFSDETAALSAIVALIPYYISIWFFRKHLAESVRFSIE